VTEVTDEQALPPEYVKAAGMPKAFGLLLLKANVGWPPLTAEVREGESNVQAVVMVPSS